MRQKKNATQPADSSKPATSENSQPVASGNNPLTTIESANPEATAVEPAPPVSITPGSGIGSKNSAATPKASTSSQLASLVGGLALILILIFGLSWFVKRFSRGGFVQSSTIKMLSAMPLGTRERLMLIDVGGKQMLLGITATQINTLHVFDEPVVSAEEKAQPNSDFSKTLMSILQQRNLIQPNNDSFKDSQR